MKEFIKKFQNFKDMTKEDLELVNGGKENNMVKKLLSGSMAILLATQPLSVGAMQSSNKNIMESKSTFSQIKDFTLDHKGVLISPALGVLFLKALVTSATFIGIWSPNCIPEKNEVFEKFISERKLNFKDIKIDSLVGRSYSAIQPSSEQLKGKYIIIYGGNGGQVEGWIDHYKIFTDRGATIICVDYRGFGRSKLVGSLFRISEKTVVEDAKSIYKFVESGMGTGKAIEPKDIILQGFSLGGAVAASVADDISRNGKKLGGLILGSPLDGIYNVAKRSSGTAIANFIYLFSNSKFNLGEHLQNIAKYNKDIPLYLCSGDIYTKEHEVGGLLNYKESDFLGFGATKIDIKNKSLFTNVITNTVEHAGHEDFTNIVESKLDEFCRMLKK